MTADASSSSFSRWARFALGMAGCFYVLMTASVLVHEVIGHGGVAVALGGRLESFSVTAGFAGWAETEDVPAGWRRDAVTWGGIAINAAVGVAALLAWRWRSAPRLGPLTLVHFWVVTTQLGQAIGYPLQGLLFGAGDARSLADLGAAPRGLVGAGLVGIFGIFAAWALRRIAAFAEEHFAPADARARRRLLLLGFALPIGTLVVAHPGLWQFTVAQKVIFRSGVLLVLVLGCLLAARLTPAGADPSETRPISWPVAVGWAAGAIATGLAAGLGGIAAG